jgi:hypothetical protein
MNERAKQWNRFITEICMRDCASLNERQREAVICFWYDTEMQNGGHSAYFESEQCAVPAETEAAIRRIGGDAIADNFRKAVEAGASDDREETDSAYYAFRPSLSDLLMDHVALHADKILTR